MSEKKDCLKKGMSALYCLVNNNTSISSDFAIIGRIKSKFSRTVNTIRGKNIDDILATTVVVNSAEECYKILSDIRYNKNFSVEGEVDYIENPKKNGYQALHVKCKLNLEDGKQIPFEVQIKTKRMLYVAERGSAAHSKYKGIFKGKNGKFWRKLMREEPEEVLKKIEEYSADIIKLSSGEDIMSLFQRYVSDLSLDLESLLTIGSPKRDAVRKSLENINELMTERLTKVDDITKIRLEKYISNNQFLIDSMQDKNSNVDEIALRILKKQTFYFVICELVKSGHDVEKIKKAIKKYGDYAIQAYTEICIMLEFEEFEMDNNTLKELIKRAKVEKFYILSKKGMIKRKNKKDSVAEIIGRE